MARFLLILLLLSACDCESVVPTPRDAMTDAARDSVGDLSVETGRPDTLPQPAKDVNVVITSDNAYGFGYGTPTALGTYFDGLEAGTAGEIFNCSAPCVVDADCSVGTCDTFGTCNDDGLGPETYVVPGSQTQVGDYVYIVTWSDNFVTQGVLGEFRATGSTQALLTGDDRWEVCATNMNFNIGSGGPNVPVIDQEIQKCNDSEFAASSWVGTEVQQDAALVVGETNDPTPGGSFPPTCTDSQRGDSIQQAARWMWFDPAVSDGRDPFTEQHPGEFLIFRLKIQDIVELI